MKFGSDLWLALGFLIKLLKLIIEVFGDDDDKAEANNNHVDM